MIDRRALPAVLASMAGWRGAGAAEPATRPLTLVVPFPAGSVTDGVARALAAPLQEALGQPVLVDNRAGAQGTLGAALVARSPADGHTLLVASSLLFVARSLYRMLPYDPVESFRPVSGIGATCMVFLVGGASPIRSVAELAARAGRQDPPLSVAYGSPSGQVALALFAAASGTRPVAVSYRGIPQAMTDLVGGHVEAAVVDLGSALAQAKAGGIRPLATSAGSRSALAPEIPVLREAFPDAAAALETMIALVAPAGTPAATVGRIDAAIRAALARPAVRQQFATLATAPLPLGPEALGQRIGTDNARWEALIRQAGIERE
ncbi:Bug family tripartite tricarboxylate transporter substrate binding protein [Paeniroseomonas aquatica]|uniref:Tripartite tricarboxylate transporter substrate binding protein n=1 Tax=Paeniroseomonas aquatica TaxID=373043 RepID=A0ABT8ABP6_9PROT|nr:tripartite tricarboxylate transporter substrate binding protein [Paeniroseomonas aquatica]MDN3567169.1 tripartite tricarboxylate transporter substrate binding protein [Paeniroseomonas aquatica]